MAQVWMVLSVHTQNPDTIPINMIIRYLIMYTEKSGWGTWRGTGVMEEQESRVKK